LGGFILEKRRRKMQRKRTRKKENAGRQKE